MRLYVLRHAIAEDGAPGQPDSARQLTGTGRSRCRLVLARARASGVRPATILSSPYARAVQTAEIAKAELGVPSAPVTTMTLAPWAHVEDLWDEVRDRSQAGDVLLSGHNPQLSLFTAWLLGARADALWLKKSALAALDIGRAGPDPRAELRWLLTYGALKR